MADVSSNRPSRRDRARATRLRMIRAAQRVFIASGYAGARMIDIAAEAGVAVQTVYFTFHTKAELLQACYELAVLGEDDPRPPPGQPWYAAMLEAGDGPSAIRWFAEGFSAIAARVAVLDDVVRSAAHEPDAVQVRARNEELRREGYARIVAHLAGRFGLRPGLDPVGAVDILLTLGGPATYRALVVDYGWPHDRFVDWLAATLGQQLLVPDGNAPGPSLAGLPASQPARYGRAASRHPHLACPARRRPWAASELAPLSCGQ
jgi:AcrR family transcriptional regulator